MATSDLPVFLHAPRPCLVKITCPPLQNNQEIKVFDFWQMYCTEVCRPSVKQLEYFTIVWYLGVPCECHGSYTSFWAHQRLSQQNWPHKGNNLFHFYSRVTRRRWQQPRRSQRRRGRSLRRAKRTWRPSRMTLGRRRTAMRIPRKTAQRKKVSVWHVCVGVQRGFSSRSACRCAVKMMSSSCLFSD